MRFNPLLILFGDRVARIPVTKRARIARGIRIGQWSIVALALIGWAWSTLHFPAGAPTPDPREAATLASEIKATWGIDVRYDGDPSGFIVYGDRIPDVWSLGRIDAPDVVPGLKAVREALSVYPKTFLAQDANYIHPIFLVRSISIKGLEVGGLIFGTSIYIPTREMQLPYSVTFAEDTFHHEFSLLALYEGQSPKQAWAAVNPPGFVYATEKDPDVAREFGHRADSRDTTDEVHEAGFMVKYAESALEEDWQTYAEQAFGHPAALIDMIGKFPRVKAKAKIFIAHYEALDPGFTAYFVGTGLRDAVK